MHKHPKMRTALALVMACLALAPFASSSAEDVIVGVVLGFQDNGNVLLEADETGTQYELVPSLSMTLTGAQSFETGLRVEVSSYTMDAATAPIKLFPMAVRALASWPTYVGFVQEVLPASGDRDRIRVRMTDGTEPILLMPPGVDATLFDQKAAVFSTENGAPHPVSDEELDTWQCTLQAVYHGTLTLVDAEIIELTRTRGHEDDGMPGQLRLTVQDGETQADADIAVGQSVVVAFDPYTFLARAIVQAAP